MNERVRRYAELTVRVGANVQAGQDVYVWCQVEHAYLARAIVEVAYQEGARFAKIVYSDPFEKLARLQHAEKDSLAYVPAWWEAWHQDVIDQQGAFIQLSGDPHPHLFEGQDRERMKLAVFPRTPSLLNLVMSGRVNWSIVAAPNEAWARTVFGDPDVERLWDLVATATRLDEDDPVAAWEEHLKRLEVRAQQLNEARFDSLHYRGPGTDLRVGLNPRARWMSAGFETKWGRRFIPNMPTEEVFTTPDFRRTEGTVRCTKPVDLGGSVVEDLDLRFEDGRIVDVQAARGRDAVLAEIERDRGACRLGEVALVDATSAVGKTGVLFHNTLFDENATCHIAWGTGIEFSIPDLPDDEDDKEAIGFNHSMVHTDVMVGGPEIEIVGLSAAGEATPILRNDLWQL